MLAKKEAYGLLSFCQNVDYNSILGIIYILKVEEKYND